MEPSASVPAMPSFQDLRRGQAAACQRFKDGLLTTVVKLPTGYGKTRLAATAFAVLRALDAVDIMLTVVPQVGQATQAGEDIPNELGTLGITTKSCNIGDSVAHALRQHRNGTLVFIVTVQALVQSQRVVSAIQQIVGGARVFLVIDEYHHYGMDTAWTRQIELIKRTAFLAMSATPDRKGEQPIFGAPHVSISYEEAVNEGAVKRLHLHSYDYRIDFVSKADGEVSSFPVSELVAEAGSNPDSIEKWMAARQARWTPKYVSPLITHPIERLIALYADQGIRAQMVVYALCCSHAQVVCEQIRALTPDGMTVDWVGTGINGRSDDENRAALERFCPPKDKGTGRRPWTLHILVSVGMAGEGLDICDAAECVFLNSPAIHNTSKQQIGRLSRVRREDIEGHINVDAASPWAQFVGRKVMKAIDAANGDVDLPPDDDDGDPCNPAGVDYKPIPSGPLVNVTDVNLIDIQSDPEYIFVKQEVKSAGMARGLDEAEADRIAADAALRYKQRADLRFSASYQQAEARDRLKARTRKVAGLALRLGLQRGRVMTREMPGEYMKRINRAKRAVLGAVDASTPEELEQHNEWVRNLEADLLNGVFPPWM